MKIVLKTGCSSYNGHISFSEGKEEQLKRCLKDCPYHLMILE